MKGKGPATSALDEQLGAAAARWLDFVQARPRAVALLCAVSFLTAVAVALPRLGINSDEEALFSSDTNYTALRRDFEEAFPLLLDPIIAVIDAPTPAEADVAVTALRARLAEVPHLFRAIQDPAPRTFFERYGLLYLKREAFFDVADRLTEAQPFLAEFARDPSTRGVAELLRGALAADLPEGAQPALERWIRDAADRLNALAAGDPPPPERFRRGLEEEGPARRFLFIKAAVNEGRLEPAAETLGELKTAIRELGFGAGSATRVRLTGIYPLSYEEAHVVDRQARWAGLASFALVSVVLLVGVGSVRAVLCILATLLAGLTWSAAFAGLVIGHLNLVSAAFGVLYIGLSVDFGIHVVLRYRELLGLGNDRTAALHGTARTVGASLVICSTTTAIAFFAFVPTDFVGVAELGLIAGTGMFLSLFANLTLLPALLCLGTTPRVAAPPPERPGLPRPEHRAPWIALATACLALAALPLVPRLYFDTNPMEVRDPTAESVMTFMELLADGEALFWNLNALAETPEAAHQLATRLSALPEVERGMVLDDFLPDDQEEKRAELEDLALFLLPALEPQRVARPPTTAVALRSVRRLAATSRELGETEAPLAAAARPLADSLDRFLESARGREDAALAGLRDTLVVPHVEDIDRLRHALSSGPLGLEQLPEEIVTQHIARDGRIRVEIFPSEDLSDSATLERFVRAVRGVVPEAFGEALVIYEAGRTVVASFQQALVLAALLITALLFALWRNVIDTLLVALPIALATLFTAAAAVLLDISLNFANIIVIPLLIGIGVDTGIHLVHRYRYEAPVESLLHTSTARAVVLSALTTTASFGTLAFATHRGMASLGQLLALGIALILLCHLLILPGLATLLRDRGER